MIGILRPLQKQGKAKGPTKNLRPILLLSTIRKSLTLLILDRIWDRLKKHIPFKKAAYQPRRRTTGNVHALKLLAEKAILGKRLSFISYTS